MRLRPWFILSVAEGLSHLDSIKLLSPDTNGRRSAYRKNTKEKLNQKSARSDNREHQAGCKAQNIPHLGY